MKWELLFENFDLKERKLQQQHITNGNLYCPEIVVLCSRDDKWCLYKSVRQTNNGLERSFVKNYMAKLRLNNWP